MQRNKNVEAVRGLAIVYMLLYHFGVSISGIPKTYKASLLLESFGQFGLISFFVISGFGTYMYFSKREQENKKVSFAGYMKKRLGAILPQWYLCLGILLFLTPKMAFFAIDKIHIIFESLFLVQNYNATDSINGVAWTLAVLVQLYLFAIPMYQVVKKWGLKAWVVSLVLAVVLKKICFSYIAAHELDSAWYVVTGIRIPMTTFDLFIAGMCAAKTYSKLWERKRMLSNRSIALISIAVLLVFHTGFTWFSMKMGVIYSNRWLSCIWQSGIGIFAALLLLCAAQASWSYKTYGGRALQFVAKYEYGIYLWHMILLGNAMGANSQLYDWFNRKSPMLLLVGMMILAVGTGYMSTMLAKSESYLRLFKVLRREE